MRVAYHRRAAGRSIRSDGRGVPFRARLGRDIELGSLQRGTAGDVSIMTPGRCETWDGRREQMSAAPGSAEVFPGL